MIVTGYIRECIENKEKTKYIREQIALGTSQYGMQTFDQSLFSSTSRPDHARGGDEARHNPDEFQAPAGGSAVHRRRLARADGVGARHADGDGDMDAGFEVERIEAPKR